MSTITHDLWYGIRRLRRSPVFFAVATIVLSLGIGANVAAFIVFNQTILKNLPVEDPKNLVVFEEESAIERGSIAAYGDPKYYFSYNAYRTFQTHAQSLQALAASTTMQVAITSESGTSNSFSELVSGNYFSVLGVRPILGRTISPQDDLGGEGAPVAVLSAEYWRDHFAADPSILDRTIHINGIGFAVIGVVNYRGLANAYVPSLFVPLASRRYLEAPGDRDRRSDNLYRWLTLVGRLRLGRSRQQAESELNSIWMDVRRDTLAIESARIGSDQWMQSRLYLRSGAKGLPFLSQLLGRPLKLLLLLTSLVLLITCASIGSLVVARTISQGPMLGVQIALGASKWSLIRQLYSECICVSFSGAAGSLVVGYLAVIAISTFIPVTSEMKNAVNLQPDFHVLSFSLLAGLAAGLLFSLAPALIVLRQNLLAALPVRGAAQPYFQASAQNLIVACESALTICFLTSAVLLTVGAYRLQHLHLGYSTDQRISFSLNGSQSNEKAPQIKNEYDELQEALRNLPGVRSVSYSALPLLSGNLLGGNITVPGYDYGQTFHSTEEDWITPDFFPTMQVPLIAGRNFSTQDTEHSASVAIADQEFVNHYFSGNTEKALSTKIAFGYGAGTVPDVQIVGVVPVIHSISVNSTPNLPFLYFPYSQIWSERSDFPATYYILVDGEAKDYLEQIRGVVQRIDPRLSMSAIDTVSGTLRASIFQERLTAVLGMALGGFTLLLSITGLYGALTIALEERSREIALRMAFGATRRNVYHLVMRMLGLILVVGITISAPLTWLLVRLLRTLNTDLQANSIVLYVACVGLLAVLGSSSALIPAWRAARTDPAEILKRQN